MAITTTADETAVVVDGWNTILKNFTLFPPLCAFSTMTTLQFITNQILSALLITFTYAIPLLSSIRAIHHRDRESYQQWLTYFLLIFLLTPLFDIIRVHDGFRLVVVIWLGQKFRGALFVYNEVFDVAMEKYGVEDKVSSANSQWNNKIFS